ncbi:hypothetical protein ABPG74_014968 [Tetrahymena malaccensis]
MALQHTMKSDILDWIFDVLQIGFIRQIFSSQFFPFSYFEVVISKVFTHAILGIVQFYFFYISEFLDSSKIDGYVLALIHVNFFASIFFALFLWSSINEAKEISIMELFISICSNLVTFITFLQFQTQDKINLAINYFGLALLNLSCLILFNQGIESVIDNLVNILKQLVQCTIFCTNYVTERDEIFSISHHTIQVMFLGYLNQICKLFILLNFCYEFIYNIFIEHNEQSPQNYTKVILSIASFIFLLVFIFYYLRRVIFFVFQVKIYTIRNEKEMAISYQNIEKEIQKAKKVFSIVTQRIFKENKNQQKIKGFCNQTCYLLYKYQKKLLKIKAKNIQVQHQDLDNFCQCYAFKLASYEQEWLLIFETSQANHILNKFTKNQLIQILILRYENGLINGQVTQFIENYLEDVYRYKNYIFKQYNLQLLGFIKQQSSQMQSCPKQIVYDLYSSNICI